MNLPTLTVPRTDDIRETQRWRNLLKRYIFGLTISFTWNPGNLVDGAGETSATVTVTGATLGDYVQIAAPYDLQGITCTGYVQAADTVQVRLQNETGGAVDLASGTWKIKVTA